MTTPVLPRHRIAALTGAVLLGLGLTACGGAGVDPSAASAPVAPTGSSGTTDSTAAAGGLTVTAEGEGPTVLRLAGGTVVDGTEDAVDGKLITGPGSCLAVQPGGQPELLILDDAVDYQDGPPSIVVDGTRIRAGERISATASRVDAATVRGVPARCADGAADVAWVLQG